MSHQLPFRPSALALALGAMCSAHSAHALDFADFFGDAKFVESVKVNQVGYLFSSGDFKAGSTTVGYTAPGSVLQLGGNLSVVGNFTLGDFSGANGTWQQNLGSLSTGSARIGNDSVGQFQLFGGIHNNGANLVIGSNSGNAALASQYLVGGSGLLSTVNLQVNGFSSYKQTGGVAQIIQGATVKAGGKAELSGGSLQAMRDGFSILASNDGATLGSFLQQGGSFVGNIQNAGSYRFTGGTFSGLLTNSGQASIEANFAPAQGIINSGTLTLAANRTLTLQGQGLANQTGGTLVLAGGTITGNAALSNDGTLRGTGVIGGSGAWVNRGTVSQEGTLAINRTGNIENQGQWSLNGFTLKCCSDGTTLVNSGTLDMGSSVITGGGRLANKSAGLLRSSGGELQTAFDNDGRVELTGNLKVSSALNNRGEIVLRSSSALLRGSKINNEGLIEGRGKIDNMLDNSGTVRATFGELVLAGGGLKHTGTLAAGSAGTLRITGGLARNDAIIALEGGTFDNDGRALLNARQIGGHGDIAAASLANISLIQFDAGNSSIGAALDNRSGGRIELGADATVSFNQAVSLQAGSALSVADTATARFNAGLVLGDGLATLNGAGSIGFGNQSLLQMQLGGAGSDRLLAAGELSFGGTLVLSAFDGYSAHAGDRFDLFDWGTRQGRFDNIDTSAITLADGLRWNTSRLYTDGSISITALGGTPPPVPEPGTWALMAAGLGLLVLRRRSRAEA